MLSAAIRVVSGFTLLSRFAGLIRDLLTVHLFGNSIVGSVFANAFAIPNLFRRLFGEGALSAAFIPEYVKARRMHPEIAQRFASQVVSLLSLVSGGVSAVAIIVLLILLATPLGANEERSLSFRLIALMLPMMPMVCMTAILGGMLQVQGKFGPPAAAPIILNALQIAAAAVFLFGIKGEQVQAAYWVGIGAVAASVIQVVWSIMALADGVKFTAWRGAPDTEPHTRAMFAKFVPALLGLGTIQINTMLDQLWAMWPIWVGPTMFGAAYPLDETSNSILSYSMRLYQFPLGVFGIAVATAVLPLLSKHADDPFHFGSVLRRGMRLSIFIGMPASVGLVLVREPIVTTLFSGAKTGFDAVGIARATQVLTGFAPGVWAYSLNHVLTRAFYAKGDTRTPMVVSISMVGLNLVLNLSLIWPLREAGLAWATGLSAMIQTLVLAYLVRRKHGAVPLDRPTLRGMAMVVAAASLMGVAVVASMRGCDLLAPAGWHEEHAWRVACGKLIVATGVGMISFAAAAWTLRVPELRWILQRAPKGADGRPVDISFD